MPFWSKKEPEQTPHVEPGMGSSGRVEPNPIKFSDEPHLSASGPKRSPNTASQVDEFVVHPGAIGSKPAPMSGSDDFATMTPRAAAPARPTPEPEREMPMHVEEPPFSEASAPAPNIAPQPEPAPKALSEEAPKKQKAGWFKRTPKAAPAPKSFDDDQERQQKWISARRRFVGALVLLVTVAIGASVLFDKAPPPPEVTIPLRIPKESSVEVSKITVPSAQVVETQASNKPQSSAPAENKTPVVSAAPAAPAASANAPAAEPKKEAATVNAAAAEDKKAAAKKAEEQKKAAEAKRQEELKKKAEEVKKKEEKSTAPKIAKGQYYLQVVALSNEARAKAIVERMKKAGVPAYLSPVQIKNGKVYRVQAGPFKSAKEAEEANGRLGIHGLTPGKVLQSR